MTAIDGRCPQDLFDPDSLERELRVPFEYSEMEPLLATGALSNVLRSVTGMKQAYFASEQLAWLGGLILLAAALMMWWSYRRSGMSGWELAIGLVLKSAAVTALVFCLLEPTNVDSRPRPGENVFVILADDSKSLRLSDAGARQTRGEVLQASLSERNSWQSALERTFDLRRYQFHNRVRAVNDFDLQFDGDGTATQKALMEVGTRLAHRPIAGILLLTDGNGGTLSPSQLSQLSLPPVYPVVVGEGAPERDLWIDQISVSQTNFEAAPVSLIVDFGGYGHDGERVILSVLDGEGDVLQSQVTTLNESSDTNRLRFQLQPEDIGVMFYDVQIQTEEDFERDTQSKRATEATLENNRMTAVVDRGGGPYRILYVCGRPNWEYKYIRRAISDDLELQVVGLVRIAKREPKFSFRSRQGETTNPFFRGYEDTDEETQQYDQPVLLRVDTQNEQELRDGFPDSAAELYRYQAIILDDIDAEYFTPGQMQLIRQFVSDRGGGLVMLGGQESFIQGGFQNTAIEDLLPVYLDRTVSQPIGAEYQLALSRDGWLEPWVRLRKTKNEEQRRLDEMPTFSTLNRVTRIKPGAEQLAYVRDGEGEIYPALVTQSFGAGRVGAMTIGDLWRWDMRRLDPTESDLQATWRQLLRWMVADVPKRVEAEVDSDDLAASGRARVKIKVRDEEMLPLDNASVSMSLMSPQGENFEITAEPSEVEAGVYEVDVASHTPGAYLGKITASAADGSLIAIREVGWTSQSNFDEFRELTPNPDSLEEIASLTGGAVTDFKDLDQLAKELPKQDAPVMETIKYPLWHQSSLFTFAIVCLVAEWGWRRLRGAP